jgi:Cu/Ag efflux protein CusF
MELRTLSALIIALAVAGISANGMAQMDHSGHVSSAAMQTPAGTGMAMEEGVVKKIDKAAGKVALAHGAQSNGMPAMTMVYRVKDAAWLDKLQVGQKIRFATDPADAMKVLRYEPVK